MALADALSAARAQADAILTGRVTLYRPTYVATEVGSAETLAELARDLPALVQDNTHLSQRATSVSAANTLNVQRGTMKTSLASVAPLPGDVVEVTDSLTAGLVGRRWVVTEVPQQGWAVLRRTMLARAQEARKHE
jgi:hypothetical protein